MRVFDRFTLKDEVARQMWRHAWYGVWNGRGIRNSADYYDQMQQDLNFDPHPVLPEADVPSSSYLAEHS